MGRRKPVAAAWKVFRTKPCFRVGSCRALGRLLGITLLSDAARQAFSDGKTTHRTSTFRGPFGKDVID